MNCCFYISSHTIISTWQNNIAFCHNIESFNVGGPYIIFTFSPTIFSISAKKYWTSPSFGGVNFWWEYIILRLHLSTKFSILGKKYRICSYYGGAYIKITSNIIENTATPTSVQACLLPIPVYVINFGQKWYEVFYSVKETIFKTEISEGIDLISANNLCFSIMAMAIKILASIWIPLLQPHELKGCIVSYLKFAVK